MSPNFKVCAREACKNSGASQPLDNFYKNKRKPDGLSIHCKPCVKWFHQQTYKRHKAKYNAATQAYRARNPEKWAHRSRVNMLKREYGLGEHDWNRMFDEQKGCCKICGIHASEIKKPLAVDHDHLFGHVRGLLCYHCNWLIGHARENTEILDAAKRYLRAHE